MGFYVNSLSRNFATLISPDSLVKLFVDIFSEMDSYVSLGKPYLNSDSVDDSFTCGGGAVFAFQKQ